MSKEMDLIGDACYASIMGKMIMRSPVGPLRLSSDGKGICGISFCSGYEGTDEEADEIILQAKQELEEYFLGKRKKFTIAISLDKEGFARTVLEQLALVPYGCTVTYCELAGRSGNPKAARAVGAVMRSNPIAIVLPCHRVVGKSGNLTGFAGGLEIKKQLLDLEKRFI